MKITKRIRQLRNLVEEQGVKDPKAKEILDVVSYEIVEIERQINILIEAGSDLSLEEEQQNIMEIILTSARRLTNADAGTLYMIEDFFSEDPITPGVLESQYLYFEIMQNETMDVYRKRAPGQTLLPPVPLEVDGVKNFKNVSAYAAITGEIINIDDVYHAEGFDFTGPRRYDEQTGYRSKSMLVLPLRDHEFQIIGVMQLINRQDSQGNIIGFSQADQAIVQAMSYQAAVTLTTKRLVKEQVDLFNAFVQVLAEGLGEKSPYNYGHINRVASMTTSLAQAVDKCTQGPYHKVRFSHEQIDEMTLAGWMHDIGKLTTPENVVSKQIKLELLEDRFEMVVERFESKMKDLEIEALKAELAAVRSGQPPEAIEAIHAERKAAEEALLLELRFLNQCNFGGEFLTNEQVERIHKVTEVPISRRIHLGFKSVCGVERISSTDLGEPYPSPLLTKVEEEFLSIQRGTLSFEERQVINDHADRSWRWLFKLPFPKKMKWLPLYAAAHHETLDGTGYPAKLKAEQLPIQSRIIAVCDVFEALTASDRPYKQPMKLSKALQILGFMVRDKHLDAEILRIFLMSGDFLAWAQQNLDPSQIDDIDIQAWLDQYYPAEFQHRLPPYQKNYFPEAEE